MKTHVREKALAITFSGTIKIRFTKYQMLIIIFSLLLSIAKSNAK